MSQVYMCDSCGQIFSVNQRGWRQFTEHGGQGETFNNAHNHGAQTRHIGPCCNFQDSGVVPRVALPPTKDAD